METKRPHNFIDMTGWIMKEHGVENSKWTVIEYKGNRKWLCRCECGNEKEVNTQCLVKGTSKDCKECTEVGNRYGRLTVIKRDPELSNDKKIKWICQCDCGNICSIVSSRLHSGQTQSCGCLNKEIFYKNCVEKDITNMRFGKLVAIRKIGQDKNKQNIWECKCDCGNITFSTTSKLCSNKKQSCGCINSKGEQKILSVLQKNNISYKTQFSFQELKNIYPLRFDFAIFIDNKLYCLIEYQGDQHYDENNFWNRKNSDNMKREYCKKNNIPLIEIPYTDFDKINYDYIKEKCNL